MARVYTVGGDGLTITAAGTDSDLIELTAADDRPIEVIGLGIYVTSEIAEAQEEWLRMKWVRGHATSGSTPEATPTPRPTNHATPAAAFTCEIDNTTIASTGTAVDIHNFGVNVRAAYEVFYPEQVEITTDQAAGLLVCRMMSTLVDDVTMSITCWVIERP